MCVYLLPLPSIKVLNFGAFNKSQYQITTNIFTFSLLYIKGMLHAQNLLKALYIFVYLTKNSIDSQIPSKSKILMKVHMCEYLSILSATGLIQIVWKSIRADKKAPIAGKNSVLYWPQKCLKRMFFTKQKYWCIVNEVVYLLLTEHQAGNL